MSFRIAVLGAGLIGSYVGGRLAAAGADVTFIGRPRLIDVLREKGLTVSDLDGVRRTLPPAVLKLATGPEALAEADLILLAVKSPATEGAAAEIAAHARPGAAVVSLQNGVSNPERLRALLPGRPILAGMVPYNVAEPGPGHVHQGSTGDVLIEDAPEAQPLVALFAAAGLAMALRRDMPQVMWAKLLVNLNNAVNALSGLPLAAQIAVRDYRRSVALCQREALGLLKQAGIEPAQLGPVPAARVPFVLSLPDFLFKRLAGRSTPRIDRLARSSMADDLVAGRRTEVDYINGEVVALARRLGRTAPVNARVIELIRAREAGGPALPADRLFAELRKARR